MFLSTTDIDVEDSVTKANTWQRMDLVAPNSEKIDETMNLHEFNEYRVMNMIPHQGYEITPDNHPLACGLGDLVHEAKGCYIGQGNTCKECEVEVDKERVGFRLEPCWCNN